MTPLEAYQNYINLVTSGVDQVTAYQQSGLSQAQEDRRRAQSKAEQKVGMGQIGGLLTGALGVQAGKDILTGKPILGDLRTGFRESTQNLSNLFGGQPQGDAIQNLFTGPQNVPTVGTVRPVEMVDAMRYPGAQTNVPTQTGEMPTAGFGDYAQGALGGYNVYQGLRELQSGDKLAGALGTAAGTTQLAGALTNIAPELASQIGAQSIGQYAGPVGALYGGYNLGKLVADGDVYTSQAGSSAASGAASGAAIGTFFGPGIGTAIGAVIGGLIGGIKGLTGSSKGQRQLVRDKWREEMDKAGVGLWQKDEKGHLWGTMPDGTTFDWSKDKFDFGTNEEKGAINLKENAIHGQAASYGGLIPTLMGIGRGKAGEAIAAQYTLASLADNEGSTANATDQQVRDRYKYFLEKNGFTYDQAAQQLGAMFNEGKIDKEFYDIQLNNLNQLIQPTEQA